jgi:hypothetical protein
MSPVYCKTCRASNKIATADGSSRETGLLPFVMLMAVGQELAKEKYPDEALQWDDDTIVDIKDHYEYLMNHEDILSKLKGLSSIINK